MTQEALRMALEALETPSPMGQYKAITAIKEALAQEQEPVAWVVYSSAENDIVWADKGKRLKQNTPLYTTPPQRSESSGKPSAWVGLTDEEKLELWEISRAALPRYATYSSLVEAKLKEKNT
jgi:predicted Fe-S protein YdhL (DUF1289 family)